MRVNVDSMVFTDPRVKRLALRIGWHRHRVVGALIEVWAVCYIRRTSIIAGDDIDATAEVDGFAASMIAAGLADAIDAEIRVKGVEDRIAFLFEQKRKSDLALLARQKTKTKIKLSPGHPRVDDKVIEIIEDGKNASPAGQPSSLTLTLTPTLKTPLSPCEGDKQKRRCRLPSDWQPKESHKAKATEHGVDLQSEAGAFVDFWLADGRVKLDWDRAFFMWLRNAKKFSNHGKRSPDTEPLPAYLRPFPGSEKQ